MTFWGLAAAMAAVCEGIASAGTKEETGQQSAVVGRVKGASQLQRQADASYLADGKSPLSAASGRAGEGVRRRRVEARPVGVDWRPFRC